MKILLVNPYRDVKRYVSRPLRRYIKYTPTIFENYSILPLDMAYLGAILKQAHQTDFIDAHALRIQAENLSFDSYQCVVVNTAPYSHWRCFQTFSQHALDVVTRAKRAGCRTVVYGPHPTVDPEAFASADCVVIGEPEELIMEALETDHKLIGPKMVSDLGRLPPPAYELFDFSLYQTNNCYVFDRSRLGRVGTLADSRGCPYHCAFCFRGLAPTRVRFHSVARTLETVDKLVNKHQCRALFWEDLVFNLNKKWVLEVCKGIEKYKVRYCIQARVDRVDEEIAEALASSGCYKIMFGVEAGDDAVLHQLQKGFDWKEVENTINICQKAGIPRIAAFAGLFAPGETRESLKRTVKNFESLNLPLLFNIWFPFPFTPIYDLAVEEGLLSRERVEWGKLLKVAGTIGNGFSRREVNAILRRIALRDRYLRYRRAGFRELCARAYRKLACKIPADDKQSAEER